MPLDNLAGKLVVPTRQQRKDLYKRAIIARVPIGQTPPDTRLGSQIDLDASACSDVAASIDSNAVIIANGVTRATATGQALYDWATALGTTGPLPAAGAAGAVVFAGAAAGATIQLGDVITHLPTSLRFQCTATGTYTPGQPVPIVGIDTGPSTNLAAGTVLTWQSPRSGCANTALVAIQADGGGLEGGANQETDDQLRARLNLLASTPPASGNDAQYQAVATETAQVAVQQAFTVPCALGPGTTAVMFTLRPGTPGANRIPTAEQLAIVAQNLGGPMPATDGIFMCTLVASPVTVVLKVVWAPSADGWSDATTWPPYLSTVSLGDGVAASANAASVLSATAFRLSAPGLTSSTAPQIGQSVGFFDLPNLTFRRKKILTVTVIDGQDYDITVDTTNGVSDTSYTPTLFQACCPWSDSLNSIIPAVVAYFDTLGPGEQFSSFFDPGLRRKRSPANPQYWPSTITNRLLGGALTTQPPQGPQQTQAPVPTLFSTTTLADVELIEPTVPFVTPVGTPGVSSYLLSIGTLLAFPE
jgi:uncharacterized phage protein gp47/JayE